MWHGRIVKTLIIPRTRRKNVTLEIPCLRFPEFRGLGITFGLAVSDRSSTTITYDFGCLSSEKRKNDDENENEQQFIQSVGPCSRFLFYFESQFFFTF